MRVEGGRKRIRGERATVTTGSADGLALSDGWPQRPSARTGQIGRLIGRLRPRLSYPCLYQAGRSSHRRIRLVKIFHASLRQRCMYTAPSESLLVREIPYCADCATCLCYHSCMSTPYHLEITGRNGIIHKSRTPSQGPGIDPPT